MSENVGNIDKHARTILGVALAAAVLGGFLEGTLAIVAAVAAILMLLTAWIKFCPLYALLGIHTRPRKSTR
jgi:hypothetical protein